MARTESHKPHAFLKDKEKAVGTGVNLRRDDTGRVVQAEDLRESPMMASLWDDLKIGVDVGHFGRLLFCIVARHFMQEDEIIKLLSNGDNMVPEDAQAMLLNVNERNYNPPRPAVIRKWQERQGYKIIPVEHQHDLAYGNLYSELRFPREIYEQVGEFYKQAAKDVGTPGAKKKATKKKKTKARKRAH
jgi:hypothetical protein